MSSLISLWDSRFSDDSGRAVALYSKRQGDQAVDVGDILAATRSQLPYIGPEQLQFHGILGAGTSFKVTREIYTKPVTDPSTQVRPSPYFVAVKHMILSPRRDRNQDADRRKRLYSDVSREIRVLMHPPLRNHCCIIPVLAYGWTNHPSEGANPYLIVDYSDHGTLTQYLRRCKIPLHERRELAVDVAVGIKVLHDNQIIHGDVKSDNILVFDSGNDYSPRPQTAKLADFGSSLFEEDVKAGASYLGTSIYNAPEIERRSRYNASSNHSPSTWRVEDSTSKMSQYKKADVYSFGLLLWETLKKDGTDIIENHWLTDGESELHFLERVCKTEENGMLQRAHRFCEKLKNDGLRDHLLNPIEETFELALVDNSLERADIEKIIESLTRGSEYDFHTELEYFPLTLEVKREARHGILWLVSLPQQQSSALSRRKQSIYREQCLIRDKFGKRNMYQSGINTSRRKVGRLTRSPRSLSQIHIKQIQVLYTKLWTCSR